MNILVVLATVLAFAAAKPQFIGYNGYPYGATTYTAGYPAVSYAAAPAPVTYAAAPHAVTYAAPAITYAAPAVVAPAFTKTQYHAQDELGQASFGHAHAGQAHAAVRDAFGNVRGAYVYVNPEGKEVRVEYTAGHGGFKVASNALPQAPVHVLPEPLVAPVPVTDTAEVVEARDAHFKAVEEARARNAAAGPEEGAEAEKAEATPEEKPTERKKRAATFAAAPLAAVAVPVATSTSYRYDAPALKAYTYAVAAPKAVTYSVAAPAYSSYYSPLVGSSLYRYASPLGYGYSSYYL